MSGFLDPYEPVSCNFHDQLEERAVLRRPTTITYRSDDGGKLAVTSVIEDVYTHEGAEYVRLREGTRIRLDRIIGLSD